MARDNVKYDNMGLINKQRIQPPEGLPKRGLRDHTAEVSDQTVPNTISTISRSSEHTGTCVLR